MHVPYKWLVATAFVFGLFMELLDMTVLNTALPALGREFGVDASGLQWLVSGYLISLAIFIPASGWIADRFGARRAFGFAVAVFTGASLLAASAGSLEVLTAARFLQGIGGGLLTPVGTAMLFRAFPPEERAKASAVLAIPSALAPTLGPVLGGWLVDAVSWRWIFYLNLPVGIAALLFVVFALRDDDEPGVAGRFDAAGFVLAGVSLTGLLYGLDRGPSAGWTDPLVLICVLGGLVLGALLVVIELRKEAPLIDLRLLRDRSFRLGNLIMATATGAMMGGMFLVPLLLQQQLGMSATASGLVTACQALGMAAVMPLANWLYNRVGPRPMLIVGILGAGLGNLAFLTVDADSSVWLLRLIMFGIGTAMGLNMIPLQASTFATISAEATARASSLFSTSRQIASAAGVAVVASLLSAQGANLAGFHHTFLVTAGIAVIGILFAWRVRRDDVAVTARPKSLEEAV
ncbi:MDR family MFS transporter [Nocardia sp. NPDC059240]|uniref:MDR family MFS transporter n=1 Tax=Nocardia sp. NPDC059240 TaxID=3346786 RepID=UPI00367FB43D